MDGLSRWDLVLWFVVAYAAVMILVRLMLNHREIVLRRFARSTGRHAASQCRGPARRRTPRRRLSRLGGRKPLINADDANRG